MSNFKDEMNKWYDEHKGEWTDEELDAYAKEVLERDFYRACKELQETCNRINDKAGYWQARNDELLNKLKEINKSLKEMANEKEN